jgi:tryptophan-rich sensory protein
VWGLLYLAMAVAAWLVWRETGFCLAEKPACARTWQALGLYLGQLVLNAVWLGIFFGHHDLGGAMLVICILLAFILATLVMFWRQTRLAGWLFLPYMIWVAFAAVINGALWMMNK